jgi:ATP-dependent Lon protease
MEVFLFPLVNVTLFPGTTKPLNIFEPRYLALFREAIKSQTPVVVGFIDDPAKISVVSPGMNVPFIRELAGYGYAQIIEERVNGTLLVFLQGQGKVRLGKVLDKGFPFIVCEAEVINENVEISPAMAVNLGSLHRGLTRWINSHIPDPSQRDLFLKNIKRPEEVVGSFA